MTIISSSSASRTVMALAMLLAGSVMPVSATVRAPDGAFHVGGLHGNGVIQVEVNGKAINGVSSPMITEMKIGGGLVVVPRENVGAGFQFASRGDGGNKYNPTLGGDCVGRAPDIGLNYIQDWRPLDFLPAENGLLLGVQPYLYQGDQIAMAGVDPGCSGSVEKHAELAPYFFHWGVLLGDGNRVPREAMLLIMSVQKLHSGAPDLNKYLTEAPAMFVSSAFSHAYTASGLPNIMQFTPLRYPVLGTNDVMGWPVNALAEAGSVSTVMLCTADIANNPLCVAIYSGFGVKAGVGRREGSLGQSDLVYMGLTGSGACQVVTDLGCHAPGELSVYTKSCTPSAHDALIRHKVIGDVDTVRDVELFKIGGSVYLVPAGQPQPADDVYVEMAEYVQASVNDLVLVGLPPSTLLG